MVHAIIAYMLIILMDAMDIIQLCVLRPTAKQILSVFGMYESALAAHFKGNVSQYLLMKYTENVKFFVK